MVARKRAKQQNNELGQSTKLVALAQSSSAVAESIFSLLNSSFNAQQIQVQH